MVMALFDPAYSVRAISARRCHRGNPRGSLGGYVCPHFIFNLCD